MYAQDFRTKRHDYARSQEQPQAATPRKRRSSIRCGDFHKERPARRKKNGIQMEKELDRTRKKGEQTAKEFLPDNRSLLSGAPAIAARARRQRTVHLFESSGACPGVRILIKILIQVLKSSFFTHSIYRLVWNPDEAS